MGMDGIWQGLGFIFLCLSRFIYHCVFIIQVGKE